MDREYIGFASLPDQIHRKTIKKGFEFTLMVAGESGLGKSTLVNTLFLTDLYQDRVIPPVEERLTKTTAIQVRTADIEEMGIKLRLTIVDTPGFGDALNSEETCQALSDYIDVQFKKYFQDESGLHRKSIVDNRVHCCLYFIPPYGRGLRMLDVAAMRKLHKKVNLVPVIGKADSLTTAELSRFKSQVLQELKQYEIQIYQFPECDPDEDEAFKKQDKELKDSVPFAVSGSCQILEVNGRRFRGRIYPWGVVEVESPLHSDLQKLRSMLIETHLADLRDQTHEIHYEAFRSACITRLTHNLTIQQPHRERSKLKRDSMLVELPDDENAADLILQQKEEEIRKMQDMLTKMQHQLQVQQRSRSLGEAQLKHDFTLMNIDKSQEVRL
uniref:Septin n=1 Tax=Daphnia galeata TaxID=27404 RepID=A0A8J2S032_9CRUS|nr:unnamed protein product [Daphnia galeata]